MDFGIRNPRCVGVISRVDFGIQNVVRQGGIFSGGFWELELEPVGDFSDGF